MNPLDWTKMSPANAPGNQGESSRGVSNLGGKALADPKIKARILDLGGVPMPMTPAEFGQLLVAETEKWGKVIRAANIKPG